MKLIVCVCDYWKECHYYNRTYSQEFQLQSAGECSLQLKKNYVRRLKIELDAIKANYVLRELLQQQMLRQLLKHKLGVQLLWLKLQPPKQQTVDYKCSNMLTQTLARHIELEQLLCWLSTLGGGYSSLGDQFKHCAQAAAQISLQQLHIGLRLGNNYLQARCKLYYSVSLIQQGQLRRAKHLIREQYGFIRGQQDQRLLHMCLGIWQRLCYEYEQRQRNRLNRLKM